LLWAHPASAAVRPLPRAKKTPVPEKINASTPKIESVSDSSITVTSSKTTQTYKIDSHTLISVNGKKGTAGDLKTGMHVEVDSSSINPNLALSIKAANASGH
jgi:hypothetical protein